jgi:hypothetical protein
MVRFSDMLGGDGDPEDAPAKTAHRDEPPPAPDDAPDPDARRVVEDVPEVDEVPAAEPPAGAPSPQDVLDRLTQYATAARAADHAPAPPEPAPAAPSAAPAAGREPDPPGDRDPADALNAGDDILPRAKRSLRGPRGKRPS